MTKYTVQVGADFDIDNVEIVELVKAQAEASSKAQADKARTWIVLALIAGVFLALGIAISLRVWFGDHAAVPAVWNSTQGFIGVILGYYFRDIWK